jgi:hypothetical protein
MSGPIVRVGATPELSKNWDKIFGKKKLSKGAKKKSTKGKTKSSKRKS